jgi:hypothetical protein
MYWRAIWQAVLGRTKIQDTADDERFYRQMADFRQTLDRARVDHKRIEGKVDDVARMVEDGREKPSDGS